jgi:PAS domain S-box-containing protein
MILLDVRMPGLDGLETAQLIKQRARTRDVPIVFLTAARDEVGNIARGYGVGAVDYVLKPFDPELLRSKVLVFAELESSRRALKRSEALLSGAFEAAPIGKTVLDAEGRIIRSNPAFARLVGRDAVELAGAAVADLCQDEDRPALLEAFEEVRRAHRDPAIERSTLDVRLLSSGDAPVWVGMVASAIEAIDATEFVEPMLLAQWVDLTVRRRAEQDRAELLLEQAARVQAEGLAERLSKLQALTSAMEALALDELLPQLASRLAELFEADVAEVEISGGLDRPLVVRAVAGRVRSSSGEVPAPDDDGWREVPLFIEGASVGSLRLALPSGRAFTPTERSLLQDAADRAALAIRRAQLHEEEHRIAVELQRGLIPKSLPEVGGVELSASYEVAGLGAQVGGDWYDAFAIPDGRLGIVVGDVTGRGIRAASAMGALRTLTRAFALAEDGRRSPGMALTLLNRHQLALGDEQLFTIIYAVIDPERGTITWANGGHPPPLLRDAHHECAYLEGGNGLMGVEDLVYETHRRQVGRAAALVLYTDGLIERRGESLDVGLERLEAATRTGPDDPSALCKHILGRLLEPAGEQYDDVTAVVARLPG